MEFEKKNLELENEEKDIPTDMEEEIKEEEEKKERRGLFGAKKRERNEKTALTLYLLAAFYLLYTSYSMIKDLITNEALTDKMRIIYVISSIAFILVSVWVIISCWKVYKRLKAEEEEQARKEAEENGEAWEESTPDQKKGRFGIFTSQEQEKPSIASRAAVYYNPADDDEEESDNAEDGIDTEGENTKDAEAKSGEAGADAKDGSETDLQ